MIDCQLAYAATLIRRHIADEFRYFADDAAISPATPMLMMATPPSRQRLR
jgi:hypothetical protein